MLEPTFSGDPIADIPALIRWRGNGLSFVELMRYLPYLDGERALYAGPPGGPLVWDGVSQQCIDAIEKLSADGTIEARPTQPLTYYIDGKVPRLPAAKCARKYARPRWLPVCLFLPGTYSGPAVRRTSAGRALFPLQAGN